MEAHPELHGISFAELALRLYQLESIITVGVEVEGEESDVHYVSGRNGMVVRSRSSSSNRSNHFLIRICFPVE